MVDADEDKNGIDCSWRLGFIAAVQFLTRIPVSRGMASSDDAQRQALACSTVFFPLVGGFLGLSSALLLFALDLLLPSVIAVLLVLAFELMLTGAFHEDAFADTCDALGGGWTREQILEILKDSRLGTYGVSGLMIAIAVRGAAYTVLVGGSSTFEMFACIIAASALGRAAILLLLTTLEPIADRYTQASHVSDVQRLSTIALSLLLSLPFWVGWVILQPLPAACGVVCSLLALAYYRSKILRSVGGSTGDFLGAGSILTQSVCLICSTAQIPFQTGAIG